MVPPRCRRETHLDSDGSGGGGVGLASFLLSHSDKLLQ